MCVPASRHFDARHCLRPAADPDHHRLAACGCHASDPRMLCAACMQVTMDGRTFDENKIKASFASEADFARAHAGEWLSNASSLPLPAQRPIIN